MELPELLDKRYTWRRSAIIACAFVLLGIVLGSGAVELRTQFQQLACPSLPDKFALAPIPPASDVSLAVYEKSGIDSAPFGWAEVGDCLFISMQPVEFGKFYVAVLKLTEDRQGWKLIRVIPVTYTAEDIDKELPVIGE